MTDRNAVLSLPRHEMRNVAVKVNQCMNHLCGIGAAYNAAHDATHHRIAHYQEVMVLVADAEEILAEIAMACGHEVEGFFDNVTPWEDRDTENDTDSGGKENE